MPRHLAPLAGTDARNDSRHDARHDSGSGADGALGAIVSGPSPRTALSLAALTSTLGVLHFVKPEPFDALIPPVLPGPPRWWTLGSGVVELAVAGLLAAPATRRVGGAAATALYVAVYPGNLQMAWNHRHGPSRKRAIALARLPFQVPLVIAANRVRTGTAA